jgi:hypothetical protein
MSIDRIRLEFGIATLNKIMKKIQIHRKIVLTFCLFIPQIVFGQIEKLGVVSYTSPQGWTKDLKQNVVGFSNLNQKTGGFCIISLYGATPGTKNSTADFTKEWNNLVVKNMKAEDVPQTDTQNEDGWTLISGGSAVESEVGKAVAFLTVISGYGKTISILAVFNDPVYVKDVDNFIKAIDIDKSMPTTNKTTSNSQPTFDSTGDLVVPKPNRQLTTADLAGVWIDGPNRMTTEYVFSGSGKSAGRDTTAFKVKTTFKSDGTYSSFFNSVRKKYETESDTKTGPYSIDGLLLSIQGTGYSGKSIVTTKYVLRGWLELPDMTVLELAGPWYDNAEIPEVNFTDFSPNSKFRGVTRWIRLK